MELVRPGTVFARAYHSQWIVDCPDQVDCGSALRMRPGEVEFRCWDCGAEAEVVWPPNREDIETMLLMRPHRRNRNWNPGESLHDLMYENLAHGISPPVTQELLGKPVFAIAGDRIVLGALTSSDRQAIGG